MIDENYDNSRFKLKTLIFDEFRSYPIIRPVDGLPYNGREGGYIEIYGPLMSTAETLENYGGWASLLDESFFNEVVDELDNSPEFESEGIWSPTEPENYRE